MDVIMKNPWLDFSISLAATATVEYLAVLALGLWVRPVKKEFRGRFLWGGAGYCLAYSALLPPLLCFAQAPLDAVLAGMALAALLGLAEYALLKKRMENARRLVCLLAVQGALCCAGYFLSQGLLVLFYQKLLR